ncbi:hypothetical protein EDC01DRAFT_776394 [Geopyxis carbonaria]|nr:hypothetical protein EDC01DRAFT_776394 [Geopyxis carbonaria]
MANVTPTTVVTTSSPIEGTDIAADVAPANDLALPTDHTFTTAVPTVRTSARVPARLAACLAAPHGAVAPPPAAARRPAATKTTKVVRKKRVARKTVAAKKPATARKPAATPRSRNRCGRLPHPRLRRGGPSE